MTEYEEIYQNMKEYEEICQYIGFGTPISIWVLRLRKILPYARCHSENMKEYLGNI